MRDQLIAAINANRAAFGIDLSEVATERLADYYELVQGHNPLLHLVGRCSAEEFAIRHILESLICSNTFLKTRALPMWAPAQGCHRSHACWYATISKRR